MRVLLIDDDPHIRKIGEMSLRLVGGFEVITAQSGPEGIGLARASVPDLILLDMMMPGMDGPSTLGLLRHYAELEAVPVVFFTAKVQRGETEQLRGLGAIGVISKPFDPMRLPAELLALLESEARTSTSQGHSK